MRRTASTSTSAEAPRFGTLVTVPLALGRQVLVPAGVCNGFQSLTDPSVYVYCFDDEWTPTMPGIAVSPLDPELGIEWPLGIDDAVLSPKDRAAPRLRDLVD